MQEGVLKTSDKYDFIEKMTFYSKEKGVFMHVNGEIISIEFNNQFYTLFIKQEDSLITKFFFLEKVFVNIGDFVEKGKLIGEAALNSKGDYFVDFTISKGSIDKQVHLGRFDCKKVKKGKKLDKILKK